MSVIGPIGGDGGNLLVRHDVVQKMGQHRSIADCTAGDFDSPHFQCFLVDAGVDFPPNLPSRTAVLARMPLAFTLHLEASAINQEVQRSLRPAIGNVHRKGLLAAAQRAEIGHRSVKTGQLQQARDEPRCSPKLHPKEDFDRQAHLDGCSAVGLLAATPPGGRGFPLHRRIKPDRQRSTLPQRLVIVMPVRGLVDCLRR